MDIGCCARSGIAPGGHRVGGAGAMDAARAREVQVCAGPTRVARALCQPPVPRDLRGPPAPDRRRDRHRFLRRTCPSTALQRVPYASASAAGLPQEIPAFASTRPAKRRNSGVYIQGFNCTDNCIAHVHSIFSNKSTFYLKILLKLK